MKIKIFQIFTIFLESFRLSFQISERQCGSIFLLKYIVSQVKRGTTQK